MKLKYKKVVLTFIIMLMYVFFNILMNNVYGVGLVYEVKLIQDDPNDSDTLSARFVITSVARSAVDSKKEWYPTEPGSDGRNYYTKRVLFYRDTYENGDVWKSSLYDDPNTAYPYRIASVHYLDMNPDTAPEFIPYDSKGPGDSQGVAYYRMKQSYIGGDTNAPSKQVSSLTLAEVPTWNYYYNDANGNYNNGLMYRVTASGQNATRYQYLELDNTKLAALRQSLHLTSGVNIIGMSNVNSTSHIAGGVDNTNMDTAWRFQLVNEGETNYFKANGGTSIAEASRAAANEYDNRLYFKFGSTLQRKIFVRHIGIYGPGDRRLIPNAANGMSANGIAAATNPNSQAYAPFNLPESEYYAIASNQDITLKKTSLTKTADGKSINYKGYRKSTSTDQSEALKNLYTTAYNEYEPGYYHGTSTQVSVPNTGQLDYTYIDFYYMIEDTPTPEPSESDVPDVKLVGKQLFISYLQDYKNTTSSDVIDYIPSGEQLLPYVGYAYPYILRGMNHSEQTSQGSVSKTVTMIQPWSAEYTDQELEDVTCSPKGGCSYSYKDVVKTTSGNSTKDFGYSIGYNYTYYQLNNFKMYRIYNVDLFDLDSNKGGRLFSSNDSWYTLNVSSNYESRYNQGIQNQRNAYTFGNNNYTFNSVHVTGVTCDMNFKYNDEGRITSRSLDCSSVENEVQRSYLSKISRQKAADLTNIGAAFTDTNDFVTIENSSNYILTPVRKDAQIYFRDSPYYNENSGSVIKLNSANNDEYTKYALDYTTYATPKMNLTTLNDFNQLPLTVLADNVNGIRNLKAQIKYRITTDSRYNRGSDNFKETLLGGLTDSKKQITSAQLQQIAKLYENNDEKTDVNKVNVFTPIKIERDIKSDSIVNQTDVKQGIDIIQKNVPFEISPYGGTNSNYSVNTNKFVKKFFIRFDFDLEWYTVYNGSGKEYKSVKSLVPAETWIEIPRDGKIRAVAAVDVINAEGVNIVNQYKNNYYIRAITTNIPSSLEDVIRNYDYGEIIKGSDKSNLISTNQNNKALNEKISRHSPTYYTRQDIVADANHVVERKYTTTNLGRIYDFKITDCTDVNFKNIFRTTDSSGVNKTTNNYFYSGIFKWDMNSEGANNLSQRTDLGNDPKRILPLGPYKQVQYINAPKMGYRISFDLKTTGSLPSVTSRKVKITPTYYYLPKTGGTSTSVIKEVDLYYKNSTGKYIPFKGSGYSIYFKPNDGYRYLNNLYATQEINNLSTNLETLNIDGTMILDNRMLSISSNTFVQAWYGEYKLPNSTIAVEKGEKDLNKALKDGYLGVKFDITCYDDVNLTPNDESDDIKLSYINNNKKQGTTEELPNTSQWDYEGYLSYSSAGKNLDASSYVLIQLERGTLRITDQELYNKIKGTVLFYDLDSRAATDFE